ncbi:MAG: PDZ domain-containing protein [Bacteroidales bacterium]
MKRHTFLLSALIVILAGATISVSAFAAGTQESRLLRFPDIKGDKIVFSYAGDIYIVSSNGGTARLLTSNIGYEMFPKISPDGKMIAFTGQYDGNSEVYVIPAEGGEPKRLTHTATLSRDDIGDRMGPNNIVMDWTPDGKKILYRTRAFTFNDFTGQLMTVPVEGGLSEKVPLRNGGFASYSPDGKKLAYNYIFREFRTWKRYQGGMADDIRIFDFETKQSEKITENINQDIIPMWSADGKKIYYISDRDSHMNLYVYDLAAKTTAQLTKYSDYDIKFPSAGDNAIVYENGGYIYKFDMTSSKAEKISISINNDLSYSRPEWKDLSKSIRSVSISPNGERLLGTARGDLFSIPAKNGITYNITNSSDANDRNADWAPDGSGFAYISDKEGEFNIYFRETKGNKERKLTDEKTYIFGFEWSPDAKTIAWSEKKNTLNLLDVATGKSTLIEQSEVGPINDYNWSPDGRYLVFTRPGKDVDVIVVYDSKEKSKIQITDNWYTSNSANFSKDGKYLLFSSARTFNPTYSQTEWNHVYTNMEKIYILPLTKDADIPLAPKNDTVAVVKSETSVSSDAKSPATKGAAAKPELKYNFDNIAARIIELPVEPGNYGNLHMIDKNVYYNSRSGSMMFDFESKKETDFKANLIFSAGYKKALAIAGASMQVIEIPKAPVTVDKPISLANVKKLVNYHQEWMQIYKESWRQMRDCFYARNMHGVDWDKVYKRYESLIPYVNHRSDLAYIIGEMIGELNVGHAYSQNGEHPEVGKVSMGLLGAEFSKDKSGYFKVEKVIEGANWSKETRSPFTMPGVEIKEGDYILAINGKSLKETDDIYEYLIGTAGSIVEIDVNNTPDFTVSRRVLVEPLANESALRYFSWVEDNIRKVSKATNSEVGYIHIPDMGVAGLNEFVKHYYPQLSKKALIIDDRGNGGGNVSPMIIERLQRTITYFSMHTNEKEGDVNPVGTFQGPKVLLVNEYSASDGDLFPYRFKFNKLGTVIGRRTWGGVVGYSGTIPVVDGGSIVTPSYAPFAADGSGWIIEGTGVIPDIDIYNDSYKEFMGEDEQLNKAIETIKQQMKDYKYSPATIPAFPDKGPKR